MRQASNAKKSSPAIFLLLSLTACSSLGQRPLDSSGYAGMTCVELNQQIARTAADISRVAIQRGNTARTDIPTWVLGGRQVADKVMERQSKRIARLQEEQQALTAARRANCGV
ncbi:MAG: hypothetical protein KF810_09885 [Rhizobiaceae bacterium]|nr:hypothetical protein [Rhizobiaceae bacterium]